MDSRVDTKPVRAVGRSAARWGVASVLAIVALVGLMSLAVVIVWALGDDLPDWATSALGVGLTLGAAGFAWIIARALRS